MAFDADLRRMLVHTIYVAPVLAVTDSGDPQHGNPVAVKARVDAKNTIVHIPDGSELASDIRIITEHAVSLQDRIWLPGVDPVMQSHCARLPKTVATVDDESGQRSHYEVAL